MERLQGPINPCFIGEGHLSVEFLEKENTNKSLAFSSYGQFVSAEHNLRFQVGGGEGPGHLLRSGSLELDKMPFLEMLQSVESPSPLCELSFQALLRLQQCKKAGDESRHTPEVTVECSRRFLAPEIQLNSCLTHDVVEVQQYSQDKSKTKDHLQVQYPQYSTTCCGVSSSGCIAINQDEPRRSVDGGEGNKSSRPRERSVSPKRKRIKKTRPTKNKEEVESQRMIHIVVERNRRRQMNNHLSALRSLMPSSYIRRGDQASIIGGAIDFVKELEQLLLSLQGQKRIRKLESSDQGRGDTVSASTSSSSCSAATVSVDQRRRSIFKKSEVEAGNCSWEGIIISKSNEQLTAEKKSEVVEVKVRVIQNHVNLNVECPKRAGQLLKAIVALDDLRLTVLHLNVTSFQTRVHYSFNLKIEDECEVGSADGISVAAHQIFSFINDGT